MSNDPCSPIIDAHGHVKWYGYDARRLVANMDEHGIDQMWLLSWEAPPHEIDPAYEGIFWPNQWGMPFADVLEAVGQYPERFIPFYAPDPRQPGALRRLRGAVEHMGVRGCGELKCRVMLDDPQALELFHYCGEARLPVVLHIEPPLAARGPGADPGYWYCAGWDNLARALETCPRTIFLGHAPGFWREISGDADSSAEVYPTGPVTPGGKLHRFLDQYPNLYCDLSAGSGLNALKRDPELGRAFLLRYANRCLFARDCFDGKLREFIRQCQLPPDVFANVMGGNARRLLDRS